MAGRGTDIKLGGNHEMRIEDELGGVTDPAERAKREAAIKAEVARVSKRRDAIVAQLGALRDVVAGFGTDENEDDAPEQDA